MFFFVFKFIKLVKIQTAMMFLDIDASALIETLISIFLLFHQFHFFVAIHAGLQKTDEDLQLVRTNNQKLLQNLIGMPQKKSKNFHFLMIKTENVILFHYFTTKVTRYTLFQLKVKQLTCSSIQLQREINFSEHK